MIIQSRLKLVGLFLVFFGPLFIAMILYFNEEFHTDLSTNHGKLLEPIKSLPNLEAWDIQKQAPLPPILLSSKWTLLYWGHNTCDLHCEADLFKLRQVRLSLGKDMGRLQTLYLSKAGQTDVTLLRLLKRNPALLVAQLKQNSPFAVEINAFVPQQIFIIDTHGNWVLKYTQEATAKEILKDLKHLLKVSRIG